MNNKECAAALLELFGPLGEHWTQGVYARDAGNQEVNIFHARAIRWCLAGACAKVHVPPAFEVELRSRTESIHVNHFNDTANFPQVKALLEGFL